MGIDAISTPMLMLAKFSGMNLPAEVQRFVDSDARIGETLSRRGFKGELREHVTVQLGDKSKQQRVLFIGLGHSARKFDCGTIRDAIKTAIHRAVAHRVARLSIPIFPNRVTRTSLGYEPTAHIIKCVATDLLAAKKGDGTLEIELICIPQAERHVKSGLARERRKHVSVCDEVRKAPCKAGCGHDQATSNRGSVKAASPSGKTATTTEPSKDVEAATQQSASGASK